jgi:hypothetical protein
VDGNAKPWASRSCQKNHCVVAKLFHYVNFTPVASGTGSTPVAPPLPYGDVLTFMEGDVAICSLTTYWNLWVCYCCHNFVFKRVVQAIIQCTPWECMYRMERGWEKNGSRMGNRMEV